MLYETLKKVIKTKNRASMSDDEYIKFKEETKKKLDIFLLMDRISDEQYKELNKMFL